MSRGSKDWTEELENLIKLLGGRKSSSEPLTLGKNTRPQQVSASFIKCLARVQALRMVALVTRHSKLLQLGTGALRGRGTLLYWTHSLLLFYYRDQTLEVKNSITNSYEPASVINTWPCWFPLYPPLCQSILNQTPDTPLSSLTQTC